MNDKPNAQKLGWTILETEYPYENPRYRIRHDRVQLPGGAECAYTYPVKGPAVFILPLTPAGDLILIRQYRYIIDTWLWEIPAGSSHDFNGDDYSDLARRELWEEIGGQSDRILFLGRTFAAPGFTTMEVYGYLALDVRLAETNHPEVNEVIEVHPIPIPQALDLLRQCEQTSAIDAYFVLQQEPLLRAIHARIAAGKAFEDVVGEKMQEAGRKIADLKRET